MGEHWTATELAAIAAQHPNIRHGDNPSGCIDCAYGHCEVADLVSAYEALRVAAVELAIPYEGLRMDTASRRWIAPELWAAIKQGTNALRALLPPAGAD